jgi:hypothetical protein
MSERVVSDDPKGFGPLIMAAAEDLLADRRAETGPPPGVLCRMIGWSLTGFFVAWCCCGGWE